MRDISVFLVGTGLTLAVSLAVVSYLKPRLRTILTDLCGTTERGDFWAASSNVTLTLVPLIFAMDYTSEDGTPPVGQLVVQVRWGLIGLAISVVVLGIVISRFIPPARHAAQPGASAPRAA